MASTPAPLTPKQTHALFDILIHHQVYAEIEAFKHHTTINQYGYPFRKADETQTTSPLLQNMLNKFALTNPAIKQLGDEFWQDKIQTLVAKLAEAELSESYDKGAIGSRKALATASSSLAEYVARGMLGGYPAVQQTDKNETFDTSRPEHLQRGFDAFMHNAIYSDLLDELLEKVQATGRLEDHSNIVQTAHEYILLNVASFLHHIFIMSPDGQYLVRLLENLHRLVPYMVVKQTLRIGNAATMINGMVRLVLTKLSVTAMTNWIGLTNNSNDGMNLLQQIISTVLTWDTSEFQKRASRLESTRDAPDKKVFKTIKAYVYASRERHEAARCKSISESKSIVAVILQTSDPPYDVGSLNQIQHSIAMEYYSTCLSIRDREELINILCKLQPDVLTSTVREAVWAMDPVIRTIHNAVDLSSTVGDTEAFVTDLIKVSKPKKSGKKSREASRSRSATPAPASVEDNEASELPTVEDYVKLLKRHAPSLHRFLHQVNKNAPELGKDYLAYAKRMVSGLKMEEEAKLREERGEGGAGNMTAPLHTLFETLSKDKQDEYKDLLDRHANHLSILKETSYSRLRSIMASSHSSSLAPASSKGTTHGPGMYLSRWNSLIDSALISPATAHGQVRRGWQVKGELDGKGLKTSSVLLHPAKSRESSKNRNQNTMIMAEGTGDAIERRERKRDGEEGESMLPIWEGMKDGWISLCRGLEIMGGG